MALKKVLVTGGAGFIGSHLCESLLSRGVEVVCLDNLVTGSQRNIAHFTGNDKFSFVNTTTCQKFDLEDGFDTVFHLASPASPVDFHRIPVEILLANTAGTYNALAFAKERGARFVLAGSSEAYGDPLHHPQKEEHWGNVNPNGVRSCYDEGKRVSEAMTMAFHRKYGVDTRIARIFNTYGPRMRKDDGRVIPNLMTQAVKGEPLTVHGDGKQTRSFCFVSDLVDGLVRLGEADHVRGGLFNLGNPHEMTILEAANLVKRLSGTRSEIVFTGRPEDDPARRQPDISKARNMLGWEPHVHVEDGFRQTIDWFRGVVK
ncbi:SDR family oxidoreductase [Candidatus Micrarchaeota archaeon]|nr:SDR family oxidoreductase [Candidatus Micrarchaeota archaeon]